MEYWEHFGKRSREKQMAQGLFNLWYELMNRSNNEPDTCVEHLVVPAVAAPVRDLSTDIMHLIPQDSRIETSCSALR